MHVELALPLSNVDMVSVEMGHVDMMDVDMHIRVLFPFLTLVNLGSIF